MSARKEFSGDDIGDGIVQVSALSSRDSRVPQQLKEIVELMNSVNRRLEDCAVEWQSAVSRKQWRILDDESLAEGSEKSWEQSLLARTYFPDKSLDEALQCLLVKNRTFTEQLNHFVALLRNDEISGMTFNFRDAQNQCPDLEIPSSRQNVGNECPTVAPLDLSSLLENQGNRARSSMRRRSDKRPTGNPPVSSVQRSFADLVKAKINLDTKFLGFEAILNGSNDALVSDQDPTACLCQICSNVLGNAVEEAARNKVARVTRARSKRLAKTTRIWTRNTKSKKQTVSLDDIGNRAPMITATNNYGDTMAD